MEIQHQANLSFCEMRNQMIMARSLPEEVTNGTLEGDIVPGDITFFRLQSTSDSKLRAYMAQGEVLPVATRSFGAIGIFAIPEMGRFYRHVLIEKNFPHHGAVAFGHFGKQLYDVFKYLGVEEIGFNQPAGNALQERKSICQLSVYDYMMGEGHMYYIGIDLGTSAVKIDFNGHRR